MPHDRDGKLLEVGDKVIIHATVDTVQPSDSHCNLTVKTDELFYPGDYKSTIVLNTKQVVKQDKKE